MRKKIKILSTFSVLLLFFNSCDKELYDEATNPRKSGNIKEINFNVLLKDTNFRKLLESVSNHSALSRTTFESQNGFTISNENVKIIQTDSIISYTMLIVRDSVSEAPYFENLVIQQDIFDNQKAAIFKYTPTQIIPKGHNSFAFEGYVSKQNLNFTGFNRNANQNVTQSDCFVEQLMCNENWLNAGTSGPAHSATSSCRNISFLFVKRVKVLCQADSGSTGGGSDDDFWSGDSNPNYGDFSNSGGGGANSESNIPLDFLPISEEVVTSPIRNPNLNGELIVTPCVELLRMTSNNIVKDALNSLKNFTTLDIEKGFSVKKNSTSGILNALPARASDNFPAQIEMKTGGEFIGAFHTHPYDGNNIVPMFSDADIRWLYNVMVAHDNNGQPKNPSIYFLTLTVSEGTYAIKIKNIQKFREFMLTSEKWTEDRVKLKALRTKYNKRIATDNIVGFQNDLLSVLKDSGVGLYEANADLSAWSELEQNENDPAATPTKTPCN